MWDKWPLEKMMCRLTIALGSGKWMLFLMEQGVKV